MTESGNSWKTPHDYEVPIEADGGSELPLKEAAWNEVKMQRVGSQLQVHLNGTLILDRPIDLDALSRAASYGMTIARSVDEFLYRLLFRQYPLYMEEIVARIFHDINNLMTGLKGGSDLLARAIEDSAYPDLQEKTSRYMNQFIRFVIK